MTEMTLADPEMTLADHAEAWAGSQGLPVPARDTEEWRAMYARWIEYAFEGFTAGEATPMP